MRVVSVAAAVVGAERQALLLRPMPTARPSSRTSETGSKAPPNLRLLAREQKREAVGGAPAKGDGVKALIVGMLLLGVACSSEPGQPDLKVSGSVHGFEAVDEANLEVFVEMTNESEERAKVECTVRAYDASGSIVGFDFFASRKPLDPGDSERFRGVIRIEDEGAFRVRKVKARDCGESTF